MMLAHLASRPQRAVMAGHMHEAAVVTCFLLRRARDGDRILILRRSQRVGTYRGRWAGVSAYITEEGIVAPRGMQRYAHRAEANWRRLFGPSQGR